MEDLRRLGLQVATVDRDQPGALARALGDGADALVDTIAFTEAHADELLAVQADVGAFAVISSAAVYRDDDGRTLIEAADTGFPRFAGPIAETQPTVNPGPETYATRKAALEQRLLDKASAPVSILRPGAIHGLHSKHPREWWLVKRMLDGRPIIPLAYGGRSRFHTSAAANIGALIATVLDQPASRVLNAADPDALSVAEIGTAITQRLGYGGELLPLEIGDDWGVSPVGLTPWAVSAPFILDTRASLALGYTPLTSYRDALPTLCDWLVSHEADWRSAFPVFQSYSEDPFDYAAEDLFLAAAQ